MGVRNGELGDEPAVYDHYRREGKGDAGSETDTGPVFRVVGVADDEATLLRVTDAEGNREATGDLRHVSLDRLNREFVPTENPDGGWELVEYLAAGFVLGGVALVAHPEFDVVSGVLLVLAGLYTLWRRGHLPLPV